MCLTLYGYIFISSKTTPFIEVKLGILNLWVNRTRDIIQDGLGYATKRKQPYNPSHLKKTNWGTWMAQLVKHLSLIQVVILGSWD